MRQFKLFILGIVASASTLFGVDETQLVDLKISVLLWKQFQVVAFEENNSLQPKEVESDLLLYYQDAEEMLPLKLMKGQKTKPFIYSGPQKLMLYTQKKGSDGRLEYQPHLDISLDAGTTEVLLLIVESDQRSLIKSLDLSGQALEPGHLLFLNMTDQPIALKLGGSDPQPIKKFEQIRLQLAAEPLVQTVTIAAYDEDAWSVVYRRRMVLKADQRFVGFFSNEGDARNLLLLRDL